MEFLTPKGVTWILPGWLRTLLWTGLFKSLAVLEKEELEYVELVILSTKNHRSSSAAVTSAQVYLPDDYYYKQVIFEAKIYK